MLSLRLQLLTLNVVSEQKGGKRQVKCIFFFLIISVYVNKRYRMYDILFALLILSTQFYMKLEEKLHAKEAEITQMQAISQVS